jgi:hypothetical protein
MDTTLFSDVARIALPVSGVLLLIAGIARAQRPVHPYLEPLTTWCLAAVAVTLLGFGLGGEAELGTFAAPLIIGTVAVFLRPAAPKAAAVEPQPAPVAPEPQPQAAPPAPASLWANPTEDETRRQGALWSR